MKKPRFYAFYYAVRDRNKEDAPSVARCNSKTYAKRIANALNVYKPRRRVRLCKPHGFPQCPLCSPKQEKS